MGGINPYHEQTETPLPTKSYTITFMPEGKKVTGDPASLPMSREGKPGSILDIADGNHVDIDHACGGVCACSTCHVYVEQGMDCLEEATEDEDDRVEEAPGLQRNSRLSCQCDILKEPENGQPIIVRVPAWNRNAVKEVPH